VASTGIAGNLVKTAPRQSTPPSPHFIYLFYFHRFIGVPRGQNIDSRDFIGKIFILKQLTGESEQLAALRLGGGGTPFSGLG
jgi:hypothetical protein